MKLTEERKRSDAYLHALPDKLNCAQSVLKAFQEEFEITPDEIEVYRAFGGGRAEDGICGSLYAAKRLLGPVESESVKNDFKARFGSVYCRELKKNKCACIECVRFADELIEKKIKK